MKILIQNFLVVIVLIILASSILAQSTVVQIIPPRDTSTGGEVIVQWTDWKVAKKTVFSGAITRRTLSRSQRIELLTSPGDEWSSLIQKLSNHPAVLSLTPNDKINLRAMPNDPDYGQSDNLRRAGYEEAWNVTPGGRTLSGTPIVVAVLDGGFDPDHRDIRDNLWVNAAEIPNNGIDDDANGYVDDHHGWDFINQDATLPLLNHGTQVTGVLGAKGDNGLGVAGTNWDIQMMLLAFDDVAQVIEAYEYAIRQRRLWNESGGARGAFVVATNASFGIERTTCGQYPAWGAMYDALGEVGILTAAAVANGDWNVDFTGDMPVDCPSDYLIGVTNLDTDDRLADEAAFGREHVDLAAPGNGSYTTFTDGRYGSFGSTSAAAPMVTGAIALLYSTPCPRLQLQSTTAPASTALLIRDVLTSTTKPLPSIQFRVATGGMLDVAEAQRILLERCGAEQGEAFRIERVEPNPTTGQVVLRTNALVFGDAGVVNVYDAAGRLSRQLRPRRRFGSARIALELDLAGLPTGLYVVEITERDRVARAKVIVSAP